VRCLTRASSRRPSALLLAAMINEKMRRKGVASVNVEWLSPIGHSIRLSGFWQSPVTFPPTSARRPRPRRRCIMVHILGINLPDNQVARVSTKIHSIPPKPDHYFQFALTKFYGIGHHTAHRLCARLQVHDKCKVKDLSPFQVTSLASFLSSPATAPPLPKLPLARIGHVPPPPTVTTQQLQAQFNEEMKKKAIKNLDPLRNLKIESELKRQIRENIAHQRMIGSYVGRRHAMHLPVRGQNTQNNAKNAKKFNRIDRSH